MLAYNHAVFGPTHSPHTAGCKAFAGTESPSGCTCEGDELALIARGPDSILNKEVVNVGKWCAYPRDEEAADAAWNAVRQGTIGGTLGFAAKISLKNRKSPAIMVYCADGDKDAVQVQLKATLARAGYIEDLRFKLDSATDAGVYSVGRGGRGGAYRGGMRGGRLIQPVSSAVSFGTIGRAREICQHWKRGNCKAGLACKYLHEEDGAADNGGTLDPRLARAGCIICLNIAEVPSGLQCAAAPPHFLCSRCARDHFEAATLSAREPSLSCPGITGGARGVNRCTSQPWTLTDVAIVVPSHVIARVLAAQLAGKVALEDHVAELDKEIALLNRDHANAAEIRAATLAARLREEAAAAVVAGEARVASATRMRNIIVEALNLACPRCKAALVDWDGCDALTCGRCRAGFCGLCLEDCKADAHEHLRQKHGAVFNTPQVRKAAHKKRAIHIIRQALDGVRHDNVELARELLNALQVDLKYLDLTNADVGGTDLKVAVGKDVAAAVDKTTWICEICTFINADIMIACEMCDFLKPRLAVGFSTLFRKKPR